VCRHQDPEESTNFSVSCPDHIWEERLGIPGKDTKKYHFYNYQGPLETIEDLMEVPQRPRPHV